MLELPKVHVVFVENLVVLVVVFDVASNHLIVYDSRLNAFLVFFDFSLIPQTVLDLFVHLFLHNSNYNTKHPRGVLVFVVSLKSS